MTSTAHEAWVVVVPATRQSEEVSAELIGEARRLVGADGAVRGLIVGATGAGVANSLGRWGLTSALVLGDGTLDHYAPEAFAHAIATAIRAHAPSAVLFPGTVLGADVGARVGQELGRRFHSNLVNFEFDSSRMKLTRGVARDRFHQVEMVERSPYLISLTPGTVGVGAASASKAQVEITRLDVEAPPRRPRLTDLGFTAADPRTMDLRDADVIVSGGRGVGGPEGFELLRQVADLLGGSVGASRPAVEAGWAPYERQVGQTGRVVKPKVYLGCGISGASQHLAGMRDAENIIAINSDPAAPLLGVATLAVVGDLREVLAALVTQLHGRQAGVA